MDSILLTIKKLIGIATDYNHFNDDLIIHINSVFMILRQMGVGPDEPFTIVDDSKTWGDFSDDIELIESVKTYVYLKTRIVFDPPTNATIMESIKQAIEELEFRLNVESDKTDEDSLQRER